MMEETTNTEVTGTKHLVKIIELNGSCGFDPTALAINGGDNVTFQNTTQNTVAIEFSNQMIFEISYLPLQPNEARTLASRTGSPGEVACTINCNALNEIVFKTAQPVIIVNRK